MMNLSRILFITAIVLFVLPLSAAERDWDHEIQVDQKVRGEIISKERNIKDNRTVINQQTNDLRYLREKLKETLDSDDEGMLQNTLRVLVPQLRQMQERLEIQDIKVEQYRVYLFRALQNADRKQVDFKQDPLDSELLEIRHCDKIS